MNPKVQEKKFEVWQQGLLDIGKRNKMMNYRKTKRSTLQITSPSMDSLFQRLVVKDENISFKKRIDTSSDIKLTGMIYLMDKMDQKIELATGEISSDLPIDEMNRTLKQLRSKANLSLEEQGINILYLSCGFLEWRQKPNENPILSPLVLIPVTLEINSISSPYKMKKLDEDIVLNPTLEYVLQNNYNITLPEIDSAEENIDDYLDKIQTIVSPSGWKVVRDVSLGLLSFLKIVMYKDLEKYKTRIFNNPVVKAFCGDPSGLPFVKDEWMDYKHDVIKPKNTFQVVNADASQQDAIFLSKNGVSFVLQGPPGTGKSQTITNIIAEGLADGKRILFVSEKMAALSVVYRRLQEVNLASYCLPLHNYKAEKKQVIQNLIDTLDAPKKKLKAGADSFLTTLEEERIQLNTYFDDLYKKRGNLDYSIYEVITELACLEDVPLYPLQDNQYHLEDKTYHERLNILQKYKTFVENNEGDILQNPWNGTNISKLSYDLENKVKNSLASLSPYIFGIAVVLDCLNEEFDINVEWTWNSFNDLIVQTKQYSLLIEIWKCIENYYLDKLSKNADLSQISTIKDRFSKSERYLSEHQFDVKLIDTQESRKRFQEQLLLQQKLVNELSNWMKLFNKTIGTSFKNSLEGINALTELSKVIMSCELYEKNWNLSNRRYHHAGEIIDQAKGLIDSLDQAKEKNLSYLISDVFMLSNKELKYTTLSERADFYINNSDRITNLENSFKETKRAVNKSGLKKVSLDDKNSRNKCLVELQNNNDDVTSVIRFLSECRASFDNSISMDESGLIQVEELLKVLTIQYRIPKVWIDLDNYDQLIPKYLLLRDTAVKATTLKNILDQEWSSDIYSMNCNELLGRFRSDYTSFFKKLGGQYKQDKRLLTAAKKNLSGKLEDTVCLSMLETLQEYHETITTFTSLEIDAKKWFDFYFDGLLTDWDFLKTVIDESKLVNEYFNKYGMPYKLISLCTESIQHRRDICINGKTLDKLVQSKTIREYHDIVNNCDEKLLEKHKHSIEYKIKALTAYDTVCGEIERVMLEDINSCINDIDLPINREITADKYYAYLENAIIIINLLLKYKGYEQEIENYFPKLYMGYSTNWLQVKRIWKEGETYTKYTNNHRVSPGIHDFMNILREERGNIKIDGITLSEIASGELQKKYEILRELKTDNPKEQQELIKGLLEVISSSENLAQSIQEVICDSSYSRSLSIGLEFLDKCVSIFEMFDSIQYQYTDMEKKFGVPYATDTENVFDLLEEYLDQEYLEIIAEAFIEEYETLPKESLIDKFKQNMKSLSDDKISNEDFVFFSSSFPNNSFKEMPIHTLLKKVDGCNEFSALECWLEYCDLMKQLNNNGLGDYLSYIIENSITVNRIVPIYRKAVLTRWYYDVIEHDNLTTFAKFHDYIHENLISQFTVHDVKQMKLAQARLDELLSNKKPSGRNVMSNALDEISILRKEGNKKRNIMPLRRLFKAIPTLLQKLKPCFMMSPLSVSYFLDSEMYEFDMVIFDEASQILPEDAIGAIYRGKQVIIAGDTKQMPPTSFFSAASKNTDEYDNDEDDDILVDIVSESILDEANVCLPSCMLSWHYRSKDESLIAFSNKEIYTNKLITFPNCKKGQDRGLEYIYVPNGYYEGKPKNCNIMEAKKCVQLVADHIQRYPDRSLGIIAFSEKQQSAIEDAINNWRIKNPMYEDFFAEDKDEPFFVKNLENVQGDERDTIIFSICYAKNKQGKMYMRFGPLGLAGGERRLDRKSVV